MRYDVTDSPLAHPHDPMTVADEIAFEDFTDEQKRVARVVLHEEISDELWDELGIEETKDKLSDSREEVEKLTSALINIRDFVRESCDDSKLVMLVNGKVKEALE